MKRLIITFGIFLAACGQAPVQKQIVEVTRVIEQPVEVTRLVSQMVGAVSVERDTVPIRKVAPQMVEVTSIVSQTVVVTANVESYIVPIIKVTPQMVEVTRPQLETSEGNIIYEFRGEGSGTSDLFRLPTGTIKVNWRNEGKGYTSLYLKNLDFYIFGHLGAGEGQLERHHIMSVEQSDKYLVEAKFGTSTWYVWIELIE